MTLTQPQCLQLPDAAALSALRAWHEGLSSREAVERFVPERRAAGGSSRSVIGAIRRQVAAFATSRQRDDLARLFAGPARKGAAAVRAVAQAIEALRRAPVPDPLIYLVHRGVPVDPRQRPPAVPLLASLHGEAGITATQPRVTMKRFSAIAASVLDGVNPALADTQCRARQTSTAFSGNRR